MSLIFIGLAIAAAVVAHGTAVGTVAIVNAVAAVWANGVIANFGPHESADVPNWASIMSAMALLLSVVFLVVGIVS